MLALNLLKVIVVLILNGCFRNIKVNELRSNLFVEFKGPLVNSI